jgi:hypothetical protein
MNHTISLYYRYHYDDKWFYQSFTDWHKAFRYLKSLPNKIEVRWIQEWGTRFYYFHFGKIYSEHYTLEKCLYTKNSIMTFSEYIGEVIS